MHANKGNLLYFLVKIVNSPKNFPYLQLYNDRSRFREWTPSLVGSRLVDWLVGTGQVISLVGATMSRRCHEGRCKV